MSLYCKKDLCVNFLMSNIFFNSLRFYAIFFRLLKVCAFDCQGPRDDFLVASRSRRLYILFSSSFFFFLLSEYLQNFCHFSVRRILLISLGILSVLSSHQLTSARLSSTQLNSACLSSSQFDSACLSSTQCNSA